MVEIKILKCKKGFGLLEVLISAVIIIMILSALVLIGRAAMANSDYNQQRAQAIYLAQSNIEIVRQIRDTNWIDGVNSTQWNTLESIAGQPRTIPDYDCYVSVTNFDYSFERYALRRDNGCNFIASTSIGSVTYRYTVSISPATGLLPLPAQTLNDSAIKVNSLVRWQYNGQQKEVEASELITNWRPNY